MEYYIDIPTGQKIVVVKNRELGIGNQLFRVSAMYSLAKRMGAQFWLVSTEKKRSFTSQDRESAIDKFDFPHDRIISTTQNAYLMKALKKVEVNEKNFFDIKATDGELFFSREYFLSPRFFMEASPEISNVTIKQLLPQTKLRESIKETESVAVHLRRGDFNKINRILPIVYQIQAMQEMRRLIPNAQFFIFSDDLDFARSAFYNIKDITIASAPDNDSLSELKMMIECKHIIIANSTFSWWAAYLMKNPNKIVISPIADYPATTLDNPKSWIQMDPFALHAAG